MCWNCYNVSYEYTCHLQWRCYLMGYIIVIFLPCVWSCTMVLGYTRHYCGCSTWTVSQMVRQLWFRSSSVKLELWIREGMVSMNSGCPPVSTICRNSTMHNGVGLCPTLMCKTPPPPIHSHHKIQNCKISSALYPIQNFKMCSCNVPVATT